MALTGENSLVGLSNALVGAVESAGKSIVRVDDGTRLTASGVLWEPGVVVATSHGVEADEGLEVELFDGSRHKATVAGRDSDTDLAVLRFQDPGQSPISRAETAQVGQIVLALGRPGRAGLQATFGILSSRTSVRNGAAHLLHTDATLYPGFSGGALVDAEGRFVGLVNLMHGRGRGAGLGRDLVEETVEQILRHGQIKRGYLGIGSQPVAISDALRQRTGLDESVGLLVSLVEPKSPAELAGILVGDIIVRMDGQSLPDSSDLRRRLRGKGPGERVSLGLLRGGVMKEAEAVLGEAQS